MPVDDIAAARRFYGAFADDAQVFAH